MIILGILREYSFNKDYYCLDCGIEKKIEDKSIRLHEVTYAEAVEGQDTKDCFVCCGCGRTF